MAETSRPRASGDDSFVQDTEEVLKLIDEAKKSKNLRKQSTSAGGVRDRSSSTSKAFNMRVDKDSYELFSNPNALETQRIQREIENRLISELEQEQSGRGPEAVFQLKDVLPFLSRGAEVIIQDDFSKCFMSPRSKPWNWNAYLKPLWLLGILVRWFFLFPIRFLCLVCAAIIFALWLCFAKFMIKDPKKRLQSQGDAIQFFASAFVFSWTGVVQYHGTLPQRLPNRIYVANHTSMIDVVILVQSTLFALVGQKHSGWVGFLQEHVLAGLGCVWFDRSALKDRRQTAEQIKEYISRPDSKRLLVFPEGTCVNNRYCVQFKKGVFDMDAEICPIAMKYNFIFSDPYWNSREQSFTGHLLKLMRSWTVMCDVWYLDPMQRRDGESAVEFSNRVKEAICDVAGLEPVDWDGYLKHFRPSQRYVAARQKAFAENLVKQLSEEEREMLKKASEQEEGEAEEEEGKE